MRAALKINRQAKTKTKTVNPITPAQITTKALIHKKHDQSHAGMLPHFA